MGNITVSLNDKHEKKLRDLAELKFKNSKGSMAKIVSMGIDKIDSENKRLNARKKLIAQMQKGFDGGKILYIHRSELYDRK